MRNKIIAKAKTPAPDAKSAVLLSGSTRNTPLRTLEKSVTNNKKIKIT